MKHKWSYLVVVLICGCTSSKAGDASPMVTSASLKSGEGGALTLDDGASIEISPGALSVDAEVTFRRTCPAVFEVRGFGGCLYEVSAESARLVKPASISVPGRGEPANCLLTQTRDGWRCLGDSAGDGDGAATASFARFAAFTTRGEISGEVADDSCVDLPFTPCGGDIVGEWKLVRACGSREQVTNQHSTKPDRYESCGPGASYSAHPYSVSATFDFTTDPVQEELEGEPTGLKGFAYERTGGGTIWEHELVTEECLSQVGETCNSSVCVSDGLVCECIIQDSTWNSAGGGSYEIVNGELFLDGDTHASSYCVQGDSLVIQRPHPAGAYQMVYQR